MPLSTHPESTLLLADDDQAIRASYGAVLEGAGYAVVCASDGVEALATARREKPSLILLDVDMPHANGWETLRHLQADGNHPPVMMLTGCTEIDDRVKGLSLGADDYLCKPCNHRELLARVHAVLRRSQPATQGKSMLVFGDLTVDLGERLAKREGQPVGFTRTEYSILELLGRQPRRLVTREQMLDEVWGYGAEANTRTIDTHVWRLRQKLQDDAAAPRWLQSVPAGGGYRLVPDRVTCPSGARAGACGRIQYSLWNHLS